MPLETDKAYAAGLIDGEGSISARRHTHVRNSFSICVRVGMCDREPLDWLASIFGGFKVAITFAVVGTIVAEFVGSDHGLGYILVLARGNLDTVTVFAAILWLIAIGFLFYFAVEVAERFFVKGRAANRKHELGAGL